MSGVEVVETASFWSLSCPYNPSPGPLDSLHCSHTVGSSAEP